MKSHLAQLGFLPRFPRVAVLSDQQGNFVYIVDAEKKVQPRRVTLGQSTPALAAIASGLQDGDTVVVDGLQRIRPGAVVNPVPFGAPPAPATPPAAPAMRPHKSKSAHHAISSRSA